MEFAAPSSLPAAAMPAAIVLTLAACAPGEATRQPVAPPVPDVALVGLAGSELTALLGAPQLARVEGVAQYRRYRVGPCQLDLFLYPDGPGKGTRVAHVEARPARGSADHAAACAALASRLRSAETPAAVEPAPLHDTVSDPL